MLLHYPFNKESDFDPAKMSIAVLQVSCEQLDGSGIRIRRVTNVVVNA